jgi:hypothetical protein
MLVEGKGVTNATSTHDGKARRIDEAEVLIGVLTEKCDTPAPPCLR